MLRITNLTKSFDEKVLDEISFEVEKGRMLSIVGPSGCGKSTLLKIISGLEEPDRGTIDNSYKTGIMFQEPRLLRWRNVAENISLGTELKSQDLTDEKISEFLSMVDLQGRERDFPASLSGGEKQRVALARTLATEPDLLLMDEPLSALDERTREQLQDKFLDICVETNKSVIFVTHSVREAWKMGDRIMVLSEKPAKIEKIIEKEESKKREQIEQIRNLIKA